MKLSELESIPNRLRTTGLRFRTGPFAVSIRSSIEGVGSALARLYADFPVVQDDEFVDFHVAIEPPTRFRRLFRPQVQFYMDTRAPFRPLPRAQAFPMLEWGLNWCIANHAHQFLILHAAVVARAGQAIILPGDPGSGKSTLCTALVQEGWHLLSDELCLLHIPSGDVHGLARPINLKNNSIDLVIDRYPDAIFGPRCHDTNKGTVAHLKPPSASVAAIGNHTRAKFIVSPRYMPDAMLETVAFDRATAVVALIEHSFNYDILGKAGFEVLTRVAAECETQELTYSSLDEALAYFDSLVPAPS
ncbi:MAG: HprK-related kinase A [Gammaproteobacteria bacterium]|nr:HprK-related kinase A [Gammaproteobacteria bacterium]